jgi:hypothetical protein
MVAMEVNSRVRVIKDSMEFAEKGKTLDTRLSRCELVIEYAQALSKYEQLGISTINPSPSALMYQYQVKRNEILVEGLKDELRRTFDKVSVAQNPKAKINHLSKLLLTIREHKMKIPGEYNIDDLEKRVIDSISDIQLETYLDTARKAEFKGNNKKALDQYYEALYFLQHDDIDDSLQKEMILKIEAKISKLNVPNTTIIDM